MADNRPARILLIGFGNTLRRDDALGCLIADKVSTWQLPGVRAIAVTQLTPELAALVADATMVIFVDARAESTACEVRAEPVEPQQDGSLALGHGMSPQFLLGLSQAALERCPRSWLVSVPAANLSVGEGLTPQAEQGMREAIETIERLIARDRLCEPAAAKLCPSTGANPASPIHQGTRP
jgi:hydrogenase maturation protease